ncbi:MAG: MoaD/ThiS family protein [Betaproteobacteria bacterium]|jgi:sulfur-carrier protein|nr:MoaD/ThiS family protein [Betaproteobacteria bacterium]NBS47481.1 MoaD/ThiS family protein [Betaproteobacteria bacterium]
MKVRVRYFASIREALGRADDALDLPAGASVAQARDLLMARDALHAEVLSRSRAVRVALDQAVCDESAVLHDGGELAFFPPVTGG